MIEFLTEKERLALLFSERNGAILLDSIIAVTPMKEKTDKVSAYIRNPKMDGGRTDQWLGNVLGFENLGPIRLIDKYYYRLHLHNNPCQSDCIIDISSPTLYCPSYQPSLSFRKSS